MSQLRKLKNYDFNEIPETAGIYKLFHMKDQNRQSRIPRVLAVDISGLLYIGETTNLRRRIKNLKKGIEKYKPEVHCISKQYHVDTVINHFPIEELFFSWEEITNHKSAEEIELNNYINEFGELPPFNFKRP